MPVLLLNNPLTDLSRLGLSKYEITLVECMHDVANHIDNLLVELPHHVKPEDKTELMTILDHLNKEKEVKRCCDKRKKLLQVTKNLQYKIDGNVHRLLRTLCEIQRILYLGDDFRTTTEILRLHNACFEHFVLMKNIFKRDNLSAKMTRDKLYGKYKHNLLVHAPIQYRLVSGESINCEDEERVFKLIKNMNGTSNNRPGHLIGNLIVRLAVESRCIEKYEFKSNEDSFTTELRNLGTNLYAEERNSLFTYKFIQENSSDWQAHLERISDFLIFENKWWKKTDFGIEFFDYSGEPEDKNLHPKIHHFRSSNISSICDELKQHWDYILKQSICIPTHEILYGDGDERVRYIPTSFLSDRITSSINSNSIQKMPTINFDEVDEQVDEEFADFQYHEYDNELSKLEVTSHTNLDEADQPIENSSTSTCSDQILNSTFEMGNKVVSENIPEKIHEKLSSTLLINSHENSSDGNHSTEISDLVNEPSSVALFSNIASGSKTNSSTYKTKEASAISIILGDLPELKKYDRTKYVCKKSKNSDSFAYNLLLDLQIVLQTKVSAKISTFKHDLEQWERSFLVKHQLSSPSPSDYQSDPNIVELCKKISVGRKLLHGWNITSH